MLKKHKQFVSDSKTIASEGRKVKKLQGQIADRQRTVRSLRGTSGGTSNNSATAAGILADSMNKPKKRK